MAKYITLDENKKIVALFEAEGYTPQDAYSIDSEQYILIASEMSKEYTAVFLDDGKITTKKDAEKELADAKALKIAQIKEACAAEIYGSTVDHDGNFYGCKDHNQKHWTGILAMDGVGIISYPYTAFAVDGKPVKCSREDVIAIAGQIAAVVAGNVGKCNALETQIIACKNVDDVKNISWS